MSLTRRCPQWHEHHDRLERRCDHAALSTGARDHHAAARRSLTPDDHLFTDDLPLRGLDRYYVDYYGFTPVRGHWVVLDSTGMPAPTSPVAQLRTNPITGTTTLDAGVPRAPSI